ncbi:hypothetical protein [Asanoa sp. NPDC050611]|uniref:hypothetical protein n=1 Tax=Asanoa sp. NPDC050611 TaxID=3157098 RepID=UPI0033CA852E
MTQPDERDPEAPEADATEQATPAEPDNEPDDDAVRVGPDVPEADAVEQARAVGPEDDYR